MERAQVEAITAMVRAARAEGEELTGPNGLLKRLTRLVLEAALEEEMTEHLGHAKHQPWQGSQDAQEGDPGEVDADGDRDLDDGDGGPRNVRNGTRPSPRLRPI